MPLSTYGLLTGRLVEHGPQSGNNPHYMLFVQAGAVKYRVALNIESTRPGKGPSPPTLQYQITKNLRLSKSSKAGGLARWLRNNDGFALASESVGIPCVDYVRGGIIEMKDFVSLPATSRRNVFFEQMVKAIKVSLADANSYVAVFGTGYSTEPVGVKSSLADPARSSVGFVGVENVHMNQGSLYQIGHHLTGQFAENGPNQDGALFIVTKESVQGFFLKFTSQDNETDSNGNPLHTGVAALDRPGKKRKFSVVANPYAGLTSAVTKRIKKQSAISASVPAPQAMPANASSPSEILPAPGDYIFADLGTGNDPTRPFKPDDDSAVRNSPYVANFAAHGVPEPVPGPRGGVFPLMSLEEVIGAVAIKAIRDSGQIVFHMAGDTGAPALSKLPNETDVADLMLEDFTGVAKEARPSFYYHLGDVVYFYGETEYYYNQFYEPYKQYPGPIFAIPGNHDGITYDKEMVSLAAFIRAFCDVHPSHWQASGGVARTTMNQPGVYFQLDAPFVSIIGLYSNCDESFGYLDQQQKLFLHDALAGLKEKRESGQVSAVIVAVHHPPLSFSAKKPSSATMRDDMDAACTAAGLWPDAVLSGHAHVYQRMTRSVPIGNATWQIPYIICGAGGYAKNPKQEVNKGDMKLQDTTDPHFRLHQFFANYGYMKMTLTRGTGKNHDTLRFEFRSPDPALGKPADACTLDLEDHVLL